MYVVRFDLCIFFLFVFLFPFIYFFLFVKPRLHLVCCTMIYISLCLCKIKNTLSLLMLTVILVYIYTHTIYRCKDVYIYTIYRCICSNGENHKTKNNHSLLSLSYDFLTSGYVFGLIGHKISHYLSEADKRVAVCINSIKL